MRVYKRKSDGKEFRVKSSILSSDGRTYYLIPVEVVEVTEDELKSLFIEVAGR